MNEPKVTFFCLAYNAEKYIEKTIESVLNQTERNIRFVIRNNGSTDSTGKIIKRYAKADKRIIYLSNKVNGVPDEDDSGKYGTRLYPINLPGEYISYLDSDDFIDTEYVEIMYKEAKKIDADMVICGSFFFNDETKRLLGERKYKDLSLKDISLISEHFPKLYNQLSTVWGKLIKNEIYQNNLSYALPDFSFNGMDTYMLLGLLKHCKSFVSVNKSLHFYRMRENSVSNTPVLNPKRIEVGGIVYERGMDCITSLKIDSPENREYLLNAQLAHICGLLKMLKESKAMDSLAKIEYLHKILMDEPLGRNVLSTGRCMVIAKHFFVVLNELIKDTVKISAEFWEFFIVRLYFSLLHSQEKNDILVPLSYFSALLDDNNKAGFGAFENRIMTQLLSKDTDFSLFLNNLNKVPKAESRANLMQCLYPHENPLLLRLKDEAVACIEEGNLEGAIQGLNKIALINPLDKDSLYLRIFLAWNINEVVLAKQFAHVAKAFYPEDEDIALIYEDVFANTEVYT